MLTVTTLCVCVCVCICIGCDWVNCACFYFSICVCVWMCLYVARNHVDSTNLIRYSFSEQTSDAFVVVVAVVRQILLLNRILYWFCIFSPLKLKRDHDFYYTFNVSFLFACLSIVIIITIVFGLIWFCFILFCCYCCCGGVGSKMLRRCAACSVLPGEKYLYALAQCFFQCASQFLKQQHHLNNIQSLVKHTSLYFLLFFRRLFYALSVFFWTYFSLVTRGTATAAPSSLCCFISLCFVLFWVLFYFYFRFSILYSTT